MKNKKTLGIMSFTLAALMLVSFVSASAIHSFGYSGIAYDSEDSEFYENLNKAIEDNNYEEWKSLMISTLTEENFAKRVEQMETDQKIDELSIELMKAWEDGDSEEVEKIREEMQELLGDEVSFENSETGVYSISSEGEDQKFAMNIIVDDSAIEGSLPEDLPEDFEVQRDMVIISADASDSSDSFWNVFKFW